MKTILAGICAALGVLNCARAWNAEGHMVTAQIAYNHLTPAARAACDALIAVPLANNSPGTSNFVTAAVWADDFKTPLGTAIWHFIDIPFSLDGTPTNGVGAAAFDVVRAIHLCTTNLLDTSDTPSNRAVSLRYLLHFVGDIEQPLHCSTAVSASSPGGDAGGNGFSITGDWSNLHSLWDAGGGYLTNSIARPLTAGGQSVLNAKVAAIETDYPYNYTNNVGTIPDPLTWALEGWSLAQTISYVGITRNTSPSGAYLTNTMATTEQRMAAGGHRLADLLNTLLTPPTLTTIAQPAGNFKFSWNAISNVVYRLQWKAQLSDPSWRDLTTLTASSNSASFMESLSQTQRFYRVVR